MQKQLELTDLEKSFLEKASVVVKSHMANDIISESLSSNDEYIRTLKNWMWKELNLRDATIQIIESHKSRYMKFSGINPHVIIKEMVSGLDDMFLSTRKEYEEGTEAWVRTLNGIKDFIGQYPFESHYNIILPAKKIEVILPEGYEFKVSIKKGKSPVDIDFLATKVSEFLSRYLLVTMYQKQLEFTMQSLEKNLRLNDLGVNWEMHGTDNASITLMINKDYTNNCVHTANTIAGDPFPIFKEFVDKFLSACEKYESSRKFLSDLLIPLGFDLKFDKYYMSSEVVKYRPGSFNRLFRVRLQRNDGYDVVLTSDVDYLTSKAGREEFRERLLLALKNNAMIKDFIDSSLSGKKVYWSYEPDLYSSKLIIESYETTIPVISVSKENLEANLAKPLMIAYTMSKMTPVIREYFKDLNVSYELSVDSKNNIILAVTLPDLPKIVRNISPTMYRRDIIAFSDQIFRKKKALHIP